MILKRDASFSPQVHFLKLQVRYFLNTNTFMGPPHSLAMLALS